MTGSQASGRGLDANLIRYLDRWAEEVPDRPALITPVDRRATAHRSVSFGRLATEVATLAGGLSRAGLGPGDRVVVMVPMSQGLYTLILALLKIGAITVFIDPWVGLSQVRACIRLVEPEAFAAPPIVHALARGFGEVRAIPLKISSGGKFWGCRRLAGLAAPGDLASTVAVSPDDTALITFTTGSSGTPKGANRTHGFLDAQHRALSREMGLGAGDVAMPALPIFILNNLACGVTSVVPAMRPSRPADVDPGAIVRQIREFGVTSMVGSPAYFAPIARWLRDRGDKLHGVRSIFTGGAPVPPDLMAALVDLLPDGTAFVGYGSTEAEPVALISAREVVAETGARTAAGEGNCVGSPAEGLEVKIMRVVKGPVAEPDWDELEQPAGEVGEVVVSGAFVNRDYFRNEDAARENKIRDHDGRIWHRMGDLAYRDDRGRLWIVGRVHNRVVRAGEAMDPVRVEAMAEAEPWVLRAALVGVADPVLGQRAILVVVALGPPRPGELQARLAQRGVIVDQVVVRRKLPVDPRHNAKIDYARLARSLR